MGKIQDLTGKRFDMLTVIKFVGIKKYAQWECLCDCGNTVIRGSDNLKRKTRHSCGCLNNQNLKNIGNNNITHNMTHSRLYRTYKSMMSRCYREKDIHYKSYGLRGIFVCDEWKNDKLKFFEWALDNGYTDELTIERIDNNKGYCPENCKWIPMREQPKNKRQNIMITYNGKTLCAEDWSKETGIKANTIRWRYKHGWDMKKIFTMPLPEPYKN